ncbi:formimidoylglutamase [Flavobacteriaceae bacterium]|nr:formimidoylglutamase [Flavobacteriaceae bacterium]
MSLELLVPIDNEILIGMSLLPKQVLGNKMDLHTQSSGLPDLKGLNIAIIGLYEYRNSFFPNTQYQVNSFRNEFYALYPGNWSVKIADLGDLPNGSKVQDTYFAIKQIAYHLKQMNIIPVFIGGSHDMIFPLYQVYQDFKQLVNVVSVDRSFDFSQEDELISGRSYMSRIIMEKPNVLFNYTNIGFQNYYCATEEKDLMNKLYFDGYRLGEILDDVSITEPIFRDADIVGMDLKCLSWQATADPLKGQPNGIDSRIICALSRYAGISDRVSFLGIYELPSTPMMNQLLAQMVWYFIEGFSLRFDEYPVAVNDGFLKYTIPLSNQTMVFYKSEKSERWWLELTNDSHLNNKSKKATLLACTEKDYKSATQDNIPERWYNAVRRMH